MVVERMNEDVVEEIVLESCDEEIVDSSSLEVIEDIIPEHYRLIPHTSYTVLKKVIDTFMTSKRHTRDVENIDTFIREGPKSDCARIDALYRVGAGIKSHIAVQEKDQYWAEQEKLFPHLKQMHDEEAASLEKTSELVDLVIGIQHYASGCSPGVPTNNDHTADQTNKNNTSGIENNTTAPYTDISQ